MRPSSQQSCIWGISAVSAASRAAKHGGIINVFADVHSFSFPAEPALFLKQAKEKHRRSLLRFSLACYTHLYHLLPEQDEAVVNDFVVVVMSEQPVVELGSFFDFLQEAGQVVVNISTVSQYVHDAVWGAVCDHIVHLIVNTLQTALGFLIFRLAGKLLLPPGSVVDPEAGAHSAKSPVLFFKIRRFGIQNAILDVVAPGTAMVKKEYPCRSKTCPRIRWIT